MRYLELYLVAVLCVSPFLFRRVFMFNFFIQNQRFSSMLYMFCKIMEAIQLMIQYSCRIYQHYLIINFSMYNIRCGNAYLHR